MVFNDVMVSYQCSLIWPFVESYWVSVVYLFSMKNQTDGTRMKKLIQQVYFLFFFLQLTFFSFFFIFIF